MRTHFILFDCMWKFKIHNSFFKDKLWSFFVAYHSVLQDNNIQLILIEYILFEFHEQVQFKRNIFLENGNFTIRKMLWSIFNRMLNSHSETNFFSKKNQVIFWTHPCKKSKKHQQKFPKEITDDYRNLSLNDIHSMPNGIYKYGRNFGKNSEFAIIPRGHQIWI